MSRRRRPTGRFPGALSVVLVLGLASACAEGDRAQPREVPAPRPDNPERGRLHVDRNLLFGPDGELLESDQKIAGLPLPKGLDVVREGERSHVYFTQAPLVKVQRYFGPRLTTTEVERIGAGVVYRQAIPKGVRGGQVRMDVSLLPATGGRTRVEVVELPPAPIVPDDPTARRAMLKRIEEEAAVLD